jgi:hypothetical protein
MKLYKDSCPICLESLETAASVVQPCNHIFCGVCIHTWAALKATCPLCLEPFSTITSSYSEEDTKEETVQVKAPMKTYGSQEEEDFECLDHRHFVKEFQTLYKQAKEAEFEVKARVVSKRRHGEPERNYELLQNVKQEIEIKLMFLSQEKKIFPKELLEEVQYFSSIIKKMCSGGSLQIEEVGRLHDVCEKERYYVVEGANNDKYCLFDIAVKKNEKNKKKGYKKGKGNKARKEEAI